MVAATAASPSDLRVPYVQYLLGSRRLLAHGLHRREQSKRLTEGLHGPCGPDAHGNRQRATAANVTHAAVLTTLNGTGSFIGPYQFRARGRNLDFARLPQYRAAPGAEDKDDGCR